MKTSVSRVMTTSTPGLFGEELPKPQGDVEHQIRLVDPIPVSAWIVAPVARIDDDPRDTQPQLTGDREPAVRVRRRH